MSADVHGGQYVPISPSYNSGYEDGRKAAKERIKDLERMLAAEKERAEYALRNLNITEKARQEEMAKRDELLALVIRYRNETPLGHQPHMIAELADAAIAKVTP